MDEVDFQSKTLKLLQTPPIHYDQFILTTGSKSNKFGWKGQDYHGVQGLYSKKDLDLMEQNTLGISEAVIVGGGLIGVKMAEMLLSRNFMLVGAVIGMVMIVSMLLSYFGNDSQAFCVDSNTIKKGYGFFIGAIFFGIVGVGFYPLLGNRVWCRFGCPMAGYMGIIQHFKSRLRITTNGGQCISCGKCSTYCEQGVDIRAYAQRGQNMVRAACVGCGVCTSVCPREVLKLENGPEEGRVNDNPIIIGHDKHPTLRR